MSDDVVQNIAYIENLFMDVRAFVQKKPAKQDLIQFLEAEPAVFRSISYESASFELASQFLESTGELDHWEEFFDFDGQTHPFHIDIGLGWAIAKLNKFPEPAWEAPMSRRRWMVFDGIGYYFALYRGRRTIKNRSVPLGMHEMDQRAFDQGIGRRLWYHVKGNMKDLFNLIDTFDPMRRGNLWRGVGVACGYVGGSNKKRLDQIAVFSGDFLKQFASGISLAMMSRIGSNSVNDDLIQACLQICSQTKEDIVELKRSLNDEVKSGELEFYDQWILALDHHMEQYIYS